MNTSFPISSLTQKEPFTGFLNSMIFLFSVLKLIMVLLPAEGNQVNEATE